ncbi:MAG: cell division protein FtsK [Tenericutes bacterium]|nr:cell division protein FtsK [Mycoplasmatota bacterium]
MSKKREYKKRKYKKKHNIQLAGIIMSLLSIIGLGRLGIVGKFIMSIGVFFMGQLWFVGLILMCLIGIYMTFVNKKYGLTIRTIGLSMIIFSFLILVHNNFIEELGVDVSQTFKMVFDQMMSALKGTNNSNGGGIIGVSSLWLFIKLFSVIGTKIVSVVFIIIGIVFLFDISLIDLIKKFIEKVKTSKQNKNIKEKVLLEEDDSNKKIISTLDELNEPDEKEEVVDKPAEIIDDGSYILPSIDLLNTHKKNAKNNNKAAIVQNVEKLERVLKDFDIDAKVVEVNVGPSVTQYEMELKSGTKLSRVLGVNREISLALAAKEVRIQAPIPGKTTIGIEIPNMENTIVSLKEVLSDLPKIVSNSKLCVPLGKNIMGRTMFMEINKTPHLLVAGATGSGKSSCINSIIVSILMRTKPSEVKLVLVDPKKVEMGMYNGAPHLLMPVITDAKKASVALQRMVTEMDRRYNLFSETNTKNIEDYNRLIDSKAKQGERMPYIVVIIDELADLMLIAAKEVEDSILRVTQLARAAGIHLIVATQRPSTDVITGLIKANLPSRLSFSVSSSIDSRTILDMTGAEKLLGRGDMLFLPTGESAPVRIQGAYVSDDEIQRVVDHTVKQQKSKYDERFSLENEDATRIHDDDDEEYEDPLYEEIVEFIVKTQKASASLLQRRFKLGYNRAARIIDLLEERGIIGPVQSGSKPREVLVKLEEDK